MQTIRVWAPIPEQVELALGEKRQPMKRDGGGWWQALIEPPAPSPDYGFVLDGEGPFPDPRSPWQPNGIHQLSRLVDHSAFNWTDAGFKARPLAEALIYELHVGTFTTAGTFDTATERLDHLVQLGVTHVELMPVNEFSGARGWGYDGVDLFAPHQAYGGPDGLKRFVNACHARGLAVLLDVVYNHLGPTGNYLGKFAPYFTNHYHTPWGAALNFDGPHSEEVRRFFCDNALMWLRDYHFDGLRLDAVHA
ncbi:MAG TPA: alpha-amylase family glycosyl hydrolase, partial [Verrucomicrobiae bacterium]|nr:alpha-amylase family glycosyl hydrolase [Verrucomicrobiae bacterium]